MSDRAARSEIWNQPFTIKPSVAGGAEREAGLEVVTNPATAGLLPGRILLSDYLGQPAWRRRVEVLRDASRQPHFQIRIAMCKTLL
jgi:hypothetical protein